MIIIDNIPIINYILVTVFTTDFFPTSHYAKLR